MRKRKVLLSIVLVLTLVINLVSWGSIRPALATEEMTTEASTEPISSEDIESSTKVQEDTTSEETSEETTTEDTTETPSYVILEDEDGNEFVAITTESTTESSGSETATTEQTTEVSTEEAATKSTVTEEFIEFVDEVDGRAGKDYSNPDNWTEEEKDRLQSASIRNSSGGYLTWGDNHWYWYLIDPVDKNIKIMMFCLDEGKTMNDSVKLTLKQNGKRGLNAVLINTAINYYIKEAGSLSVSDFDATAYQIAQLAIWNQGSTSSSSDVYKKAGRLQNFANKGNALINSNNKALTIGNMVGRTASGVNKQKEKLQTADCSSANEVVPIDGGKKIGGVTYYYKFVVVGSSTTTGPLSEWRWFCKKGDFSDGKPGDYANVSTAVFTSPDVKDASGNVIKSAWDGGAIHVSVDDSGKDSGNVVFYCVNKPTTGQALVTFTLQGGSVAKTILGAKSASYMYKKNADYQHLSFSNDPVIPMWTVAIGGRPTEPLPEFAAYYPYLTLSKVNDNDDTLVGCSFQLVCPDGTIEYVSPETTATDFQEIFKHNDDEETNTFGTGAGTYYLQEIETIDGHRMTTNRVKFELQKAFTNTYSVWDAEQNANVDKTDTYFGLSITPVEVDAAGNASTSGDIVMSGANWSKPNNGTIAEENASYLNYAISVKFSNERLSGEVDLLKNAEKLTDYVKSVKVETDENGNTKYGGFEYSKLPLQGAKFQLYAYNDIIVDGQTLFKAENPVEPGYKWCNDAGCTKHTVSYVKETDASGNIKITGLPAGAFYLVETYTDPKYLMNTTKHTFSMVQDYDDVDADGVVDELVPDFYVAEESESLEVVNQAVYANPRVYKADAATGERLAGAEFTLYAKGTNLNYDDEPLFTEEDCVEAVVSRNLEKGTEEKEDGWVPIETAVSNENGEAFFSLIPYGDYLVVETKAPPGYTLPEESWKFSHIKEQTATQDMYSNGIDYSHGFVFGNTEKTVEVVVNKTGSVVTGSEDVTTDYGTYKKLTVEQRPLAGVLFNVLDENGAIVDSIITNAEGTAKADGLMPGLYYVQEANNGNSMLKLDETKYEVDLRLDEQGNVDATKTINCVNELVTTQLALYKNGEQAYITNEVLNNPEQFTGVTVLDENSAFSYDVQPLSGAVFGIYAKTDMKNSEGTVVVNAGDCVGYTVSDDFGKANLSELLLPGEYTYKEVIAPESYKLDGNAYSFTLLADGSDKDIQINPTTPLINTLTKSSIRLIKQDMDTEEVLEGVEFELYNQDNVLIGAYVTDENGEINVIDLPLGNYYFVETEPLDGYYEFTDKVEYELTDDGYLYTIIAYNEEIPDKPKLGTVEALDVFCGILLLGCVAGLGVIWMPRRKRN